jgi:hypothetical protein
MLFDRSGFEQSQNLGAAIAGAINADPTRQRFIFVPFAERGQALALTLWNTARRARFHSRQGEDTKLV